MLRELKRLEFFYERTGAKEPLYVFKHALTQDVAYESLLTTRRQTLHAAAGTALETQYTAWLTERAEELAHHFTRGEVWEKAFTYLTTSGDKARQAYANPKPPLSRWQRRSRMKRYARPSCNRRWCKKFTNVRLV